MFPTQLLALYNVQTIIITRIHSLLSILDILCNTGLLTLPVMYIQIINILCSVFLLLQTSLLISIIVTLLYPRRLYYFGCTTNNAFDCTL